MDLHAYVTRHLRDGAVRAPRSNAHAFATKFRRAVSRSRRGLGDERGALLAETVVAIGIFTLLGAAVLSAMSTTHRSTAAIEATALAENIGRNQIETVLAEPYVDPPACDDFDPFHHFDPLDTGYPGYEVSATAKRVICDEDDPSVSFIEVNVQRGGNTVLTLQTIRLKTPEP